MRRLSVNDIYFFSSGCKADKEALKIDEKVLQFYFKVFLRTSFDFEMNN